MVFGQALTDCRRSMKLAQSPPRSTPAGTCPDPREGFAATSPTRTRDDSQKDFICRGPGLHVAISAYGGPGDRPILEFHADAVAVVRKPLRVNHLGPGQVCVKRSNSDRVARLPGVLREYASAVRTDVIGERPLSIGSHTYCCCETHYDDDRQPPFYSAIGPVIQRVHAQTLTGQT